MPQQLDTLIGFAVVMAIASLLITILTQMISTLLGLRGSNLVDALEVMMVTLDPKIEAQSKGVAKRLANAVLTNPAISDSVFPAHWTGLLWWRRATAIRADELLSVLERLAGTTIAAAADDSAKLKDLNIAARQNYGALRQALDQKINEAEAAVTEATPILQAALNAFDTAQTAQAKTTASLAVTNAGILAKRVRIWAQGLREIDARLQAQTGQISEKFQTFLSDRLAAANFLTAMRCNHSDVRLLAQGSSDLEKWFNSVQDRAQQWYGTHTRIVTSVCALLAAFILQLDTFQLFARISSDPDVRSRLVAEADTLQKENSDLVLSLGSNDSVLNQEALDGLIKQHPGVADKLKNPPSDVSEKEMDAWIRTTLLGSPNVENMVSDYDRLFAEAKLTGSSEALKKLNADFDSTGLLLLPNPYPWTLSHWCWPRRHLCGLLVTAGLLCLGAPFWFNVLKTITNLRPILANRVDDNPKQDSPPIPQTT